MSLLLDLIRQLLEYLGIPGDQLDQLWENYANRLTILRALESPIFPVLLRGINLPGWERREYGWTRSIVRMIGTVLPLEPCPRPHFQCVLDLNVHKYKENTAVCKPGVPSLADVPWVSEEDRLSYTTFRHDLLANKPKYIHLEKPCDKTPGLVPMILPSNGKAYHGALSPSNNTSQKIAALEDELMQLRAQIAAIVAIQDTKSIQSCSETMCSFGSPITALPPPSLTSTPVPAQQLPSAAPIPPPPPPLPVPSIKPDPGKSARDLIKQRKEAYKRNVGQMVTVEKDSGDMLPSMMDVLKGMNTIRLRAVERSPGGTPLTQKGKKRRSLNDPASIIAHALKQKFAHRHNDDSFDKENKSQEEFAFSSPETPQFGRHLLKPVGRRPQKKQVLMASQQTN
ncbi:mitochondrial fission regulator 2 [Pelobates fuscus]|uniref:mitochondrial fission regulator 2 n=1 Tax=Pelobates fuscus TaxID=191477 RepID=UPI002FE4359A